MAHRLSKGWADELEASKSGRSKAARLVDLCRLMLQGHQFVAYDRVQGRLRVLDSGDQRYRDDQITPLYTFIVSSLAVEWPSPSILPASPSTEDILKARISLEAIRWQWSQQGLKHKLQRVVEWLVCAGNAAFHTFYDPALDIVRNEVVGFYDLFFRKGATDQSEAVWSAVRRVVDRETLAETFPDSKESILKAKAARTRSSLLEEDTVDEEMVEVFDVYYQDGSHEVRLADHVLDSDEWILGTWPVRHIWYMRVPGVLWGKGVVEDLIDLQVLYNKKNLQIVQAIEMHADPYILCPSGAGIPANAFRRGSDKVIRYNSLHGTPSYLAGLSLPPEAFTDLQRIKADMLDRAGVHSTSLGKTARGVNSARHVDSLQQADASQLQPTQGGLEAACEDVIRTSLVLMRRHYGKARWIRAMDSTGLLIHRELKATDLLETPEVSIEAGSLFRNETADRRQQAIELHAAGLISPDQAMQDMAFGTSGRYLLDKVAAIAHAQELLNGVKAGLMIELWPTDDTDAVDQVFREFMRTEEFYGLDMPVQQHIATIYAQVVLPMRPAAQQVSRPVLPEAQPAPGPSVPGLPLQGPETAPDDTVGAAQAVGPEAEP